MFPKCDSLNAILCCFFRDSYEEDKKSFEITVTTIKTDIDCLFGLILSLDMQDKVTISKSFSWTLCFKVQLIYINITFHVGGLRFKGAEA